MEPYSRRQFITRTSAGLAAAGVAATLPWATGAANATQVPTVTDSTFDLDGIAASEPLVAYLRDVRSGEISIFMGSEEVILEDRAMAHKLIAALKKGR